jgi:hypothetical protein
MVDKDNPFVVDGDLQQKADFIVSHSQFSPKRLQIVDPDNYEPQFSFECAEVEAACTDKGVALTAVRVSCGSSTDSKDTTSNRSSTNEVKDTKTDDVSVTQQDHQTLTTPQQDRSRTLQIDSTLAVIPPTAQDEHAGGVNITTPQESDDCAKQQPSKACEVPDDDVVAPAEGKGGKVKDSQEATTRPVHSDNTPKENKAKGCKCCLIQ